MEGRLAAEAARAGEPGSAAWHRSMERQLEARGRLSWALDHRRRAQDAATR
jgi:hypothetical protein